MLFINNLCHFIISLNYSCIPSIIYSAYHFIISFCYSYIPIIEVVIENRRNY